VSRTRRQTGPAGMSDARATPGVMVDHAPNPPELRYGTVLPAGTATEQVELAVLAEQAGWDGVFVWEAAYGPDAWSMLAAMAARTSRVRLGTMLTPLPWRRPWKVASQVATLDQLSGGRAILAVGVGALDTDLPETGEITSLRDRAGRMDEGIDLIRMLWEGGRSYHGKYYDYETSRPDLGTAAKPVQDRIPIWVVGVWPAPKSMRRVLRCDGIIPQYAGSDPRPQDAAAVRGWLTEHGLPGSFDIIADGETPADDPQAAAATTAHWASAGCTWWLETRWEARDTMRQRIAGGPPRSA
jgi:alkanesulfonate monooxygenase SsuD/methylene tetrahydromethanopterin reductase-like flavin-dependent oxidoreductase (luciferase family)